MLRWNDYWYGFSVLQKELSEPILDLSLASHCFHGRFNHLLGDTFYAALPAFAKTKHRLVVSDWCISFYNPNIVAFYLSGKSIIFDGISVLNLIDIQVEHETSAIGTKMIASIATIVSILLYFLFRHWISRQTQKPLVKSSSASSFARNTAHSLMNNFSTAIDR